MRERLEGFAIRIVANDGHPFFAMGQGTSPYVARTRKMALDFLADLREHGIGHRRGTRVVRVVQTVVEAPAAPATRGKAKGRTR